MTRFAIRGLLSRKLRTALTAIAIVLGVAMISGTYVLTDSIDQAFDRIFTDIRKGSNAIISGKAAFDLSDGSGVTEPTLDENLLAQVRGLPSVADAEGSVDSDATQLIGDDGKAVVSGGAPNLGFSIANGGSVFNPLTLVKGDWPGPNEVAVDKETAAREDFAVGETIGVQSEGPVERLRVSAIVQFSSGFTIGGATLAGFDLPTAQRLFKKVDRLDEIAVASKPDIPNAELVREIEAILPRNALVRTGEEQAATDSEETSEFISFLQTFLLAFGGIALFVGSFVIANSLSITIAQRTREFATLRTLGATNRQVLGSIIVEALVVGVVASAVGLFLGLLLARGLFRLFDAVGFTLPNAGLVFEPRTIYVALAAGILVTVLASVYPGFRATTVPPIAAVREGAALPGEPLDALRGTRLAALLTAVGAAVGAFAITTTPGNTLVSILISILGLLLVLFGCALFPSRTVGAVVSCGLGFAALVYGLFVPGLGTTSVLLWMGVGVLLVFFGVARVTTKLIPGLVSLASPVAVWTVSLMTLLIWPFFTLPYWLLRRGARGPGGAAKRIGAFVLGALVNPIVLVVVLIMITRRAASSWRPEWPAEFPGILHVLLSVLWPFWVLPYWLLRRGAWGPGGAAKRIGAFVLGALINPIVLLVVLVMVVRRAVTRWHPRWPTTYPGVVPGTVTANVGRENSRRNAQRTASTASALMIGLALVTLVATLAAGIVQTFRGAVDDLWKASDSDYAITAQNNFSPIPVDAANSAAQAPGVVAVMNVRTGEVRAFDETTFATAVDPTARELINMKWKDGSQDVLANLGETGAFVDDGYADDNDLEVGSTVEVTFPDGTTATYTVDGIFDPPTGGSPFGSITISTEAWDAKVENPRNLYTFIAVEGDVSDENTATLEEALADYPNAKVQTREQFIDNQIAGLNAVLNILYVLLALSVLVSLFGIVNTLVLTVFERTREIGMLRAIGMTRLQVRRMIRHESVITALIGAMIGIVLGVVLAVILIARVEFIDFAFPTTQIIVFVIAAVLVGIVAAIFPARRAAKLDPLEAIAYE